MDELFEALTLIQTLRIKPFPVILLGKDYWNGLVSWMHDTMQARHAMIGPDDMDLFQVIDDPETLIVVASAPISEEELEKEIEEEEVLEEIEPEVIEKGRLDEKADED